MGAQYWVMLIVAGLTAGGVLGTLWQKQRSEHVDRALKAEHEARVEWWRRFQWAAEHADGLGNPESRVTGRIVMKELIRSPLITASERDIARAAAAGRQLRNNRRNRKGGAT
ncbi:hypothetical protein [Tsukamurella tyrosinosolvens]|uniref:hypothetical protein n=1 Tax=Tsukamurella tyrosinosolvens TaxID=57704 RepID=UPI002DD447AB|nr:hypothetical protein [Tsukamurella tyrosinosolvens]MEC4611871.1 hypothetical protein [Tsukamurella tyrosinosolvens]